MREGTYIRFVSLGILDRQKTERWQVETKEDEDCLGEIKWFGRWRRYSFFPYRGCVFEETCLREISTFIEERTREHRARPNSSGYKEAKHECARSHQ